MGLLSRLFGRFSKGIECADLDQHIIYMHPKSAKRIKVNENITVSGNSLAIFVCKDRVADVLYPGKFKLNGSTLPETFKRLHLDKKAEKGGVPTSFKSDIYFVNMKEFHDATIDAYIPFVFRNTQFGKVKGYPEGLFNLKVVDASELVSALLAENAYIKNGYALKQIQIWVGDAISRLLERAGMSFVDILTENDQVNETLNERILDEIGGTGISIMNIRLESIKLSKGQQAEIAEFLANRTTPSVNYVTAEQALEQIESPTPVQEAEIVKKIRPLESAVKNNEPQDFNPQEFRRGTNPEFLNPAVKPTIELQTESTLLQPTKKVCKYCGAQMDISCKFCPECGFRQIP